MTTADTLQPSSNPVEEAFSREYFDGRPYTEEMYQELRHKCFFAGMPMPFEDFERMLRERYEAVTQTEFIDFQTRFTYVDIVDGKVCAAAKPDSLRHCVTRVARVGRIGTSDGDVIRGPDNHVIARLKMRFYSFHEYNAPVAFAGIASEFIAQMPEELRKSDRSYFYTITGEITERYCEHRALVAVYEAAE